MGVPRLVAIAFTIACAWPWPVVAQLRASQPSARTYVDGVRTCNIVRVDDSSTRYGIAARVSCDQGSSFRAWIGGDALLVFRSAPTPPVLNAWARALRVVATRTRFDDIVLVRSTNATELADELAERLAPEVLRGVLVSAMPDLGLVHRPLIAVPPNDPRYGGQWYFDKIHMEDIWRMTTGRPEVTISVVDTGCDLGHPEFVGKLKPGIDVVDQDNDPSFLPDSNGNEHGTACAGIIAARTDNGDGIAGACPECTLSCIRMLGRPGQPSRASADIEAFGFAFDSGASVVSNSWGFESAVPVPTALQRAITRVMTEGRGGLGMAVVFAAGNDAAEIRSDEIQAIDGIITVGAINTFDEATSFSNRGACLALVAPTGTLSTDIRGADGESPGDYTSSFGGTSSAAPVVAGIVGLLLSKHPELTNRQVRDLLVRSTRPAPFAVNDENGHDLTYGFGVVDPAAALRLLEPVPSDGGVDAMVAVDAAPVADAAVVSPPSKACSCSVAPSARLSRVALLALGVLLFALMRRSRHAYGFAVFALLGCAPASPRAESRPTVRAAVGLLRPNTPGATELPPRYAASDTVQSFASAGGGFRVHFTRTGSHAVPSLDADSNGTPDYVELVAATYDEVLASYRTLGFRTPPTDEAVPVDHGGDGRFDVYLVDYGGSSDGSYRRETCATAAGCTGYMLQENDFVGYRYPSTRYAVRLLASHEFFHAVQAAYNGRLGSQGAVLSEGTAVWASERFDASLGDVEGFASAYLERVDRPLGTDPVGAAASYSYGTGVFFEYLSTRFGNVVVRKLWEELSTVTDETTSWLAVLDTILTRDHTASFSGVFEDFIAQCAVLGRRSTDPMLSRFPTLTPEVFEGRYSDDSVRFFPAGARFIELRFESGAPVEARATNGAAELQIIAVLVAGDRVLSTTRGIGTLSIAATTGADRVILGIVDSRPTGMSRVGGVCVDATGVGCTAPPAADAGVDAGGRSSADASVVPPVMAPGGCSVSRVRPIR